MDNMTSRHGGKRSGSGRPKGSPNKRAQAVLDAAQQTAKALAASIPDAFTGDAHALLMAVYKDPAQPIELRVDAAKAAVRYEKPALSSVTATHTHLPSDALDDDDLSRRIARLDEELARRLAREAEEEGGTGLPH